MKWNENENEMKLNKNGMKWKWNEMLMCLRSKNDKITEVAQLLIANGIDVNQTNNYGVN